MPSRCYVTGINEAAYCAREPMPARTLAQRHRRQAGTMQAEVGHGAQPHSGTSAPLEFRVTPSTPPSPAPSRHAEQCRLRR